MVSELVVWKCVPRIWEPICRVNGCYDDGKDGPVRGRLRATWATTATTDASGMRSHLRRNIACVSNDGGRPRKRCWSRRFPRTPRTPRTLLSTVSTTRVGACLSDGPASELNGAASFHHPAGFVVDNARTKWVPTTRLLIVACICFAIPYLRIILLSYKLSEILQQCNN